MLLAAVLPLQGQTNDLPALVPPYGELPPTFWEEHGTAAAFGGFGIIVLAAFGLWLMIRPKPKIIVPPEVEARKILENLRQQPENGVMLSRVTQVVRHYFSAVFNLSPGELTTTEFCREISGRENIGPELSTAAAGLLHDCDASKFSSKTGQVGLDAANRALKLIAQAELRRAQLHQPVETQTKSRSA